MQISFSQIVIAQNVQPENVLISSMICGSNIQKTQEGERTQKATLVKTKFKIFLEKNSFVQNFKNGFGIIFLQKSEFSNFILEKKIKIKSFRIPRKGEDLWSRRDMTDCRNTGGQFLLLKKNEMEIKKLNKRWFAS